MLDELPSELLAPVLALLAATDLSRVSRCCRSLSAAASATAATRVCCHRHAMEPHAELTETWLWLAALLELEWAISAGGETTFVRGCQAGVIQACGNPGDGRLGLRSVVTEGPEPLGAHIAPGFSALSPAPLELYGQGTGDRPIAVARLSGVQSVAAGSEHALLLREDGRLLACGNGFRGRLGNGDENPRLIPTLVAWPDPPADTNEPAAVAGIAAGAISTAVVTAQGELWTFGAGGHGVLGHGNRETLMLPKRVESLSGVHVLRVSIGASSSACCSADGSLYTFGLGALGHGSATDSRLVPTRVERWGTGCQHRTLRTTAPHIVDVGCGWKHTVAVDSAGMAWSFGEVGFGRLGLGDVMAGVLASEGLSSFGMNATEDLCATIPQPIVSVDEGDRDAEDREGSCDLMLEPEPQSDLLRTVVRMRTCAAGDFHSAFLTRTGQLFTCGRGEYGRLGHGDHEDVWQPKLVRSLATSATHQQTELCRLILVACGEAHTVVAAADGRVFTCGSNRAGALGHGDILDRLTLEPIPGLNLRARG